MGCKYYIKARLSGYCSIQQEARQCRTLIGCILTLIRFRIKYPIVDIEIRNGYKSCDKCKLGDNKPRCYHLRKQTRYTANEG